jgi:hypothetical protein
VNKHILQLLCAFFLLVSSVSAQIGGNYTYQFLNIPLDARTASMGGDFLSFYDDDINVAVTNPAAINEKLHHGLALSFVDYFSDISTGYAAYSHTFNKAGSYVASLRYINYGRFTQADASGQTYGNFSAGEYAFNLGWGRSLDPHFRIGANLKMIYSGLEDYNSFGLAVDLAGMYWHEESQFAATFLVRNFGRQLDAYVPGNIEPLPFNMQLGISKRFSHLPFRFSILYNHLEKFDLTYDGPFNQQTLVDPLTGDSIRENKVEKFADKLMRHFVFGGEFSPSKNFSIRLGYNYQRRRELSTETKKGITGFSFGFGFRVKMFRLSYSWCKYHLGASPNYFTITTNISEFFPKK